MLDEMINNPFRQKRIVAVENGPYPLNIRIELSIGNGFRTDGRGAVHLKLAFLFVKCGSFPLVFL